MLLNTVDYVLPNSRPRTYIIAVLTTSTKVAIPSFDMYFKTFVKMMTRAKRRPPSVLECLLPDDHELVAAQLKSRQDKPHADWEKGSIKIHQDHYASKGLRWGSLEPTEATAASPWLKTLTAREQDCLICNMHLFPEVGGFDVSQSIYRKYQSLTVHGVTVSPAMIPKAVLWWVSRARLQIGYESMVLAGFPVARHRGLVDKHGDEVLKDLAGNCFSGTLIVAIFLAFCVLTPWQADEEAVVHSVDDKQKEEKDDDSNDLHNEDPMSLLRALTSRST